MVPSLTVFDLALLILYGCTLGLLALLGCHRLWLLWRLLRRDGTPTRFPSTDEGQDSLPSVLVQLPIYNEPAVAARVLNAAAAMDYPFDRLRIQVLDDSTDGTPAFIAEAMDALAREPLSPALEHVRRADRQGFKAGALAHGMASTTENLIAIFDADFIPPVDFLQRMIPQFLRDENLAMAQARWGHLNRGESWLTRAQAIFLDGHFFLEHPAREEADLLFNFNGTAGIWRRAAIEDADGWAGDTLTEDLDLSYRAQLRGWRFAYRHDVQAPAELPSTLAALRGQQRRWVKGSAETSRKLFATILRSRALRPRQKLEAAFHLLGNSASLPMLALVLLTVPVVLLRERLGLHELAAFDAVLFIPGAGAFFAYLFASARCGGQSLECSFLGALLCILLGIGLSFNNGIAALEGWMGRRSPFVRTPKRGNAQQTNISRPKADSPWSLLPLMEAGAAAMFLVLGATAWVDRVWPVVACAGVFAGGFGVMVAWTALDLVNGLRLAAPRAAEDRKRNAPSRRSHPSTEASPAPP